MLLQNKPMNVKKYNPALKKLLIVLGILVPLHIILYARHSRLLKKEAKQMQAQGWCYAAANDEYSLSYRKSGNEFGKHIIVALSGMGISDYSIQLEPLTEYLSPDNLLVCIDRAGYGLSGDTKRPQTNEQIVQDYRTALKNAGIQPPYVLLPHSIAGVYATYWESKYPDEIEGVFYLDCGVLSADDNEGVSAPLLPAVQQWFEAFGGYRIMQHFSPLSALPENYTASQRANSKLLALHSAVSAAQISEAKLSAQNCKNAYENIVQNDIPKAYLNAASFHTRAEWLAADDWVRTFRKMPDATDEERIKLADQNIERCANIKEITLPYTEALGNCAYLELSGDHMIYMQQPMQCAVLLSQFLAKIDSKGDSETLS